MEKHSLYDCQRQFNCLTGSYNRHFAGKPRATRDLRLLEELIDQLRHLRQQVETLPDSEMTFPTSQLRSHIKTQLGQFEEELIAITEAYQQATFAERFGYLGDRINQQFAIYREHFAGQPRLSRRPQLLQRAISNLQEIHGQLSDPVFDVLENQGDRATNIQLVAENLESLHRELEMIELEHEANSLSDRVASLGSAANAIIQEYNRDYAGKDRRNCDLIRLGWLCDLLTEIAQQMAEISSLVTSEANSKNWEIVQQCRLVYEQEYAQIEAAKTSA